jgi:hypothetical protein
MVFPNLTGQRPWKRDLEYSALGGYSHKAQAVRDDEPSDCVHLLLDLSTGRLTPYQVDGSISYRAAQLSTLTFGKAERKQIEWDYTAFLSVKRKSYIIIHKGYTLLSLRQ